eukprot:401606_1
MYFQKKFLIIGGCNILFIVVTFILVFVPFSDNGNDFGSSEAIAIVSVIWCFINSLLAFFFLKDRQRNNLEIKKKKDYLHSDDNSQQNSDENIQILVKDEGDDTTDINKNNNNEIELEEIKIKFNKETEKLEQIEYEYNQIIDEYNKYREETENIKDENEQYKQQIVELQIQIDKLDNNKTNNSITSITKIDNDIAKINKLKKELAAAQKTIIEMTSVVGVQQKFPTVQEIIQQFRSIRDQKHHDTSTLLKKFIKNNNKKLQKYYVNQIIHEIMFEILCECYKYLEMYRLQIYDKIANILNMKYAIAQSFEINDIHDTSSTPIIMKHQIRLLSNIFGPYFKNNFKFVLQKRLTICNENKQDNDNDHDNDSNNYNEQNLISNILLLITNKYSKYLTNLNQEEINGL